MQPTAAIPNLAMLPDQGPTSSSEANSDAPSFDLDPPPPYAESPTLVWSPFESHFRIPSYESSLSHGNDDSIRLPNYSGRSLCRFHPYWPYIRPVSTAGTLYNVDRYLNTVYDDEYIPLDIPSPLAVAPVEAQDTAIVLALPTPAAVPPMPAHLGENEHRGLVEEEQRQRLHRLRAVIGDFMHAVLRAFEARPAGPPFMVQEPTPEPTVIINGQPTPVDSSDTQTAADFPDEI